MLPKIEETIVALGTDMTGPKLVNGVASEIVLALSLYPLAWYTPLSFSTRCELSISVEHYRFDLLSTSTHEARQESMYRLLLLGIGEEFKPLEFLRSQFEITIGVNICPMKKYRLTELLHIGSLEMIVPSSID